MPARMETAKPAHRASWSNSALSHAFTGRILARPTWKGAVSPSVDCRVHDTRADTARHAFCRDHRPGALARVVALASHAAPILIGRFTR